VRAVFPDCDLVGILRRSSFVPEHAHHNITNFMYPVRRISYFTRTFTEPLIVIHILEKDQQDAQFS